MNCTAVPCLVFFGLWFNRGFTVVSRIRRRCLSTVHCVTAFTCWSYEEKAFHHVRVLGGLCPFVWQAQKWHEDLISKFNFFNSNCFTLRFARFMWVLQRQIWSCGHAHLYRGVTLQPLFPLNTLYRCICICNCIKPQYPDNIGQYSSQRGLQGAQWHFVWASFWWELRLISWLF